MTGFGSKPVVWTGQAAKIKEIVVSYVLESLTLCVGTDEFEVLLRLGHVTFRDCNSLVWVSAQRCRLG